MRNSTLKVWSIAAIAAASATLTSVPALAITLMQYNVENLFDVNHDAGKNDFEFLPSGNSDKTTGCAAMKGTEAKYCTETDWTQAGLDIKLGQIKKVVDSLGTQPDIMTIEEVENEAVVKALAKKLGYKSFAMTDSPDARGIDVALLYNESAGLDFVASTEYALKDYGYKGSATRNILEVEFLVEKQEKLLVYVNHWPSQSAPAQVRRDVADILSKIIADKRKTCKACNIVVVGDFNTIDADRPYPFEPLFNDGFSDVDSAFRKGARDFGVDIKMVPFGTYFFNGGMTWNILDRFFVSSELTDKKGLEVDVRTYKLWAPLMILGSWTYKGGVHDGTVIKGIPKRYNHNATTEADAGFSDHFPVVVDLHVVP